MKLFRLIFIITLSITGTAQATSIPYALMPAPQTQFFTTSGTLAPLSGGKVYFCQPGTTCGPTSVTLKDTYTDSTGGTANVNPVVLNSNGQANIWLKGFYKVALYDSLGNLQPGYPIDNVSSVNNSYIPPTGLPWVDASAYGSLAAALTALGTSTQSVLYVTTALPALTASTVVPANVNLVVLNTGSITVNTPYTLTINGPFYAGNYKAITGTGTVAGLQESRIEWFGGKGDGGTTDDTAAVALAFNTNGDNGSHVIVTPGKSFKSTVPVVLHKNQIVDGGGTLLFTGTGDGLQSTWTENTSTVANITVRDIAITNTNGSNTGGGFVDLGGKNILLQNVTFDGWAYGNIFDQTSDSSVLDNTYNTQSLASIWLVNGADHTAGANALSTNNITVERSRFKPTAVGIADDGGYSHNFAFNNYSGGTIHIRFTQTFNPTVTGGQFHASSSTPITFNTTKLGGTTGGLNTSASIKGAEIYPASGQVAVSVDTTALTYITLENNIYNTSGAVYSGIPDNLTVPNWQGDYSSATTYAINDVVLTNPTSVPVYYISLVGSNTNHNPPTSPTYWALSYTQQTKGNMISDNNHQDGAGVIDNTFNINALPSVRASAFFSVPMQTGTYVQSGNTVTVTLTTATTVAIATGYICAVDITSGAGVGQFNVPMTVIDQNHFTYVAGSAATASGNATLQLFVLKSYNIVSIYRSLAGIYGVFFINALDDGNYVVNGSSKASGITGTADYSTAKGYAQQASQFTLMVTSATALADNDIVQFVVIE